MSKGKILEMNSDFTNGGVRPTDVNVALALAVVKSKPVDLTVKGVPPRLRKPGTLLTVQDYISSLRRHVISRRLKADIGTESSLLDTGSYWRERYAQARDRFEFAEKEKHKLLSEIKALKSATKATSLDSSSKKRLRSTNGEDSDKASVKKVKKSMSHSKCDLTVLGDLTENVQSEALGSLLPDIFRLQVIIRSKNKTKPAEFAQYIIKGSNSLLQVVLEMFDSGSEHKATVRTTGGLQDNLVRVSRALAILTGACGRLGRLTEGANFHGRVVFATTQIFKSILDAFDEVSRQEAIAKMASSRPKSPKSHHGKSRDSEPVAASHDIQILSTNKSAVLAGLISLLGNMINLLDPRNVVHQAVFEGCVYYVIRRLGSQLFITVFGHARGQTVESEILQSRKADCTTCPPERSVHQARLELESPHLIKLLKHAMNVAPSFFNSSKPTKRVSKNPESKPQNKSLLVDHALDRLQRTLVRSIFGNGYADQDAAFSDCLEIPRLDSAPVPEFEAQKLGVEMWFKEELWRILGWDVLSKQNMY